MSIGATSADAKSGDGGANRDGGRDRAMSRGVMSCDGATGKASNGYTMTGGMTSGAATTTVGAEVSASATGTISAMIGTTIPGATMTGATAAARGSLSTATAG